MRTFSYQDTEKACYAGYMMQAMGVSLPPILFTTFIREIGISYSQLGMLLVFSFAVQIFVDVFAVILADKIGYRKSAIIAHGFIAAGLCGLGIFPCVLGMGVKGLYGAAFLYSFGSGFLEMLITPLIDLLPSEKKISRMSFLHSCYCWGEVATIIVATAALKLTAGQNWWLLPICFSLFPLWNMSRFRRVPVIDQVKGKEKIPFKDLINQSRFFLFCLIMIAAGAVEQIIIQWSSALIEVGLELPKLTGDLLGPCLFAALMGIGRMLHSLKLHCYPLMNLLQICGGICLFFYLMIAFSPFPLLSMLSCGGVGIAVSIMWPGTISLCAGEFPNGGTAMFGILAIFGDIGCMGSSYLVGVLSERLGLRASFGWMIIFPAILIITLLLCRITRRRTVRRA